MTFFDPKVFQKVSLLCPFLSLLGAFWMFCPMVFFDIFLVRVLLPFLNDFRSPFGTLLGYFGGSKWSFLDTFLEVSQKDATLVSFGPSWEDLGSILRRFGHVLGGFEGHLGRFWVLLQALCRHLGRPPGRQNFITKPFAAPHQLSTGRNVAAAT